MVVARDNPKTWVNRIKNKIILNEMPSFYKTTYLCWWTRALIWHLIRVGVRPPFSGLMAQGMMIDMVASRTVRCNCPCVSKAAHMGPHVQ